MMPTLTNLAIPGVYLVEPEPARDQRGWFMRYFCVDGFRRTGRDIRFVQFNHSRTCRRGSIRGLHLQLGEAAEDKLVRCIRGRVMDVLVDLRRDSGTLLQKAFVELSEHNRRAVFIPRGVAHGFQTLDDDTELLYHHTNFHAPAREAGVRHDDPLVGIAWPLPVADISAKDLAWPLLSPGFNGFGFPSMEGRLS